MEGYVPVFLRQHNLVNSPLVSWKLFLVKFFFLIIYVFGWLLFLEWNHFYMLVLYKQ